jgi:hypothetical protein
MPVARFTVDLEGQPRALFSVNEKRDETTLGLKSPFINARSGRGNSSLEIPLTDQSQVIEQRYSIHPSRKSPKINVIKQTMVRADGRRWFVRHYTQAIKKRERFAFLFCRRCGLLNRPEYLVSGKFDNISLGSFDLSYFTLIYAVIVGARDTVFLPAKNVDGVNVIQRPFNNLRIVVLWTFLNIPSQPRLMTAHSATAPPEDAAAAEAHYSAEGHTSHDCTIYFMRHCIDLKDDLIKSLETELSAEDLAETHRVAYFFNEGFRDSYEYTMHRIVMARKPYIIQYQPGKA